MKRLGHPLPRTIAVVRMLGGLGDMLCVVPALRALRRSLPAARLVLIGLPSARLFVSRFGCYIDELVESPGYPGIPELEPRIDEVPGFFTAMQERRFDLALQMHGDGSVTNAFTVLLGARFSAGFFVPGRFCPDRGRFLAYPEDAPEVTKYVRLMEFLGVPPCGETLEFPLRKEDREEVAAVGELRGLWPWGYICVHPGARGRSRRWSPERFARLADALSSRGMPVVLTGGPDEAELTRRVAGAMKTRPIDVTGRTSLGALAVLLSNARLLVSNDTGISHLADALHVPSVVIFVDSDPVRWAPLDRALHRAVGAGNRIPPPAKAAPSPRGAGEAAMPSVEEALAAAEDLLLDERFDWNRESPLAAC